MKKAIVTGASGFIGRALVRELLARGVEVAAVARNPAKMEDLAKEPRLQVVACTMEDILSLEEKVPKGADVFFHLAWQGSSGAERGDYALQLSNVKWSIDAVRAAKQLGCSRFVGAGSLAEFDVNAYSPLDGSMPNRVSTYGAAKVAAHYMTKAECSYLGLEHIWARLSNAYGEGDRTSNFVNFAAKTLLKGEPPNFTAGEHCYDFVHVSDIAQGLYCLGERGQPNFAYYIGSSRPAKLKSFILQIRDAIDPALPLNLGAVPFRGVALPESAYDCSKLIADTGYSPKVSFGEGFAKTLPWIKAQVAEGKL